MGVADRKLDAFRRRLAVHRKTVGVDQEGVARSHPVMLFDGFDRRQDPGRGHGLPSRVKAPFEDTRIGGGWPASETFRSKRSACRSKQDICQSAHPLIFVPQGPIQGADHGRWSRIDIDDCPDGVPSKADGGRGCDPLPLDIADDECAKVRRERYDVVEVASYMTHPGEWLIAGCELEPINFRQESRHQTPLEKLGDLVLVLIETGVLEGDGGAVGHRHEELDVFVVERLSRERSAPGTGRR